MTSKIDRMFSTGAAEADRRRTSPGPAQPEIRTISTRPRCGCEPDSIGRLSGLCDYSGWLPPGVWGNEEGLGLLAALPKGKAREKMIEKAFPEWAGAHPTEAMAWLEHSDCSNKAVLAEAALEEWAKRDPQAAARFLDGKGDASMKRKMGARLALRLADGDPQAAVDWAFANLQGRARSEAIASVVGGFSTAYDWVAGLEPLRRKQAMTHLASTVAGINPLLALENALSLDDRDEKALFIGKALSFESGFNTSESFIQTVAAGVDPELLRYAVEHYTGPEPSMYDTFLEKVEAARAK